ncbi:hypothetical protein CSKR_108192, partial [Clonorchis sinensis]
TAGSCLQMHQNSQWAKCMTWCVKTYGKYPYGETNCIPGNDCIDYCRLEKIKKACVVIGEDLP